MTIESAAAKLMYLLGEERSQDKMKKLLGESLRGEMTIGEEA